MSLFKGAGVAIVTPMKEDLSVDYDALRENIDYQIDNGTDCIVIVGTTGEGSTLSMEEHKKAIECAVKFAKGRVPVVAGTGSNCTETAVELSVDAQESGVDGVLVVTPYYNKATQQGLIKHYSTIAEAIKVPMILYNVPSRTGCNIMPQTVAELVKNNSNIRGLKDATGNIEQAVHTMTLVDGNLDLYSGNDDQVVPLLSIGGVGVISVLSNIAPRYVHDMVMSYLDGDTTKAAQMQLKAYPLIKKLFCEVNPIPVKAAMQMLGMKSGPLRLPLTQLSAQNEEPLREELKKFGLL